MDGLTHTFDRLRKACDASPEVPWATRADRLARLKALVADNAAAFAAAISADFGHRSAHETDLLEVFPSLSGINHALSHGRRWMRGESRATGLWFLPARSRVTPQPLGVAGIIVPWNYPLYLAVGPLVSALVAGNRAMVKLSELTPKNWPGRPLRRTSLRSSTAMRRSLPRSPSCRSITSCSLGRPRWAGT